MAHADLLSARLTESARTLAAAAGGELTPALLCHSQNPASAPTWIISSAVALNRVLAELDRHNRPAMRDLHSSKPCVVADRSGTGRDGRWL